MSAERMYVVKCRMKIYVYYTSVKYNTYERSVSKWRDFEIHELFTTYLLSKQRAFDSAGITCYCRLFLCTLKKNSGSKKKTQIFAKKLRFLSIVVKTQVKNRDFPVTLLHTPPKKLRQQKTQGLDQLLINEYSLGRPKKA